MNSWIKGIKVKEAPNALIEWKREDPEGKRHLQKKLGRALISPRENYWKNTIRRRDPWEDMGTLKCLKFELSPE